MDADRNLLFGVLAMHVGLLSPAQFAEACAAWAAGKNGRLADLLVERGWLNASDRADVDKLLRRKLAKHGGDAKASLAGVTTDEIRQSLAGLNDPDVQRSLTPPVGHILLHTTDYVPEARERYTLSRLHATGGIGRVWLARDASLGRDVALKELRPERAGQPAVWGRFLREAQVTGQLEHPSIVPVYELGRRPEDQAPFYTMRFIRGRTLADASRTYHERRQRGEARPLELRELLTALVGVCNAVAYAHSRGVLHRDLKPQNVVLGDFGEVMVLDWGLAKVAGVVESEAAPVAVETDGAGDETVAGQVLGTPAYMAPEQAEGRLDLLDVRTDVYGLGAILYEVLTGQAPFAGPDTTSVLRRVVHEAPASPRSAVPGTPGALEAVCFKALAKKPTDRYASAKELASELQRWLADEPVAAYRDPLTTRLMRWGRRHRTLAATAAVALMAVLGGLAAVLAVQAQANTALAGKNAELATANRRVKQQYALAIDAIKTFHTGVSEDFLLKQDQFKPLRDRLLRSASDFYGKLTALLGTETDPASRRDLARANFELAELTAKVGRTEDALAAHRAVLAQREALAADPAASTEIKADVGRSLTAVASLLDAIGRGDEAEATFRRGEALLAGLVESSPPDVTSAARAALASCRSRLGRLLAVRGRFEDALAAYRLARADQRRAADVPGAPPTARLALADTLCNLGRLVENHQRPQAAEADYREAVKLYQALAAEYPGDPAYRGQLGETHEVLSANLAGQGRGTQALAEMRAAMATYKQLAHEYPAVTEYRSLLAGGHYASAHILCDFFGRDRDAEAEYRVTLDMYRQLAAEQPAVLDHRFGVCETLTNLGDVLRTMGRAREAEPVCREAVAVARALLAKHPTDRQARGRVAYASGPLGDLLFDTGRTAEAGQVFHEIFATYQALTKEDPTNHSYQTELAWCHSRLAKVQWRQGRPAEAVASLRKAIALHERQSTPPGTHSYLGWYSIGCYHALLAGLAADPGSGLSAAEGRTEADRALVALRKAIANYYHDRAAFRSSDLEALRNRADFQRLVKDLEKPAKPLAP